MAGVRGPTHFFKASAGAFALPGPAVDDVCVLKFSRARNIGLSASIARCSIALRSFAAAVSDFRRSSGMGLASRDELDVDMLELGRSTWAGRF